MIKTHHTSGFIRIPVSIIKDKTLSLEDKAMFGLIAYYEQIPNFRLNRTYISKRHNVGTYTIKSCIETLSKKSYAACIRKANRWVYKTTHKERHYTNIPKTILSSDLSLQEIGLYMIIAYAITLPGVKPGIGLYETYCSNCRSICLKASKKLQLAGLYVSSKLCTCKYSYTLYTLTADGSFELYAPTVDPSKTEDVVLAPPIEDVAPEQIIEPTTVSTVSSDTHALDIKDLLFYDHEIKRDFFNYEDGCENSSRKMAYDMIISAVEYAQKIKYITINGIKVYYEKFFSSYVSKLGDRDIREQVVRRILDALDGDSEIRNLDLYICGIISKVVPLAQISQLKSDKRRFARLASEFGSELANKEYASSKQHAFSYGYIDGHFFRVAGLPCA